MSGIIVLAVLASVVIAALEISERRHATMLGRSPEDLRVGDDRDLARSKLDLLALGGAAEPFSHKPVAYSDNVVSIRRTRSRHGSRRPR